MGPATHRLFLLCSLAALFLAGQPGLCGGEAGLDQQAGQEDSSAQLELGLKYFTGEGVPQDYAKAANCFLKAAEQGDALAQSNLGVMYYEGLGVERDYTLSHMWLSLAEAQGDEISAAYREIVAEKMTPHDLMESRKLAREWKGKEP